MAAEPSSQNRNTGRPGRFWRRVLDNYLFNHTAGAPNPFPAFQHADVNCRRRDRSYPLNAVRCGNRIVPHVSVSNSRVSQMPYRPACATPPTPAAKRNKNSAEEQSCIFTAGFSKFNQTTDLSDSLDIDVWHTALLDTYTKLRKALHCDPPKVSPIPDIWQDRDQWRHRMMHTKPTPNQVWELGQNTVLSILCWNIAWLEFSTSRNWWIGGNWAEWIWAFLVKLKKRLLTAGDVTVLRELAKRCIIVRDELPAILEDNRRVTGWEFISDEESEDQEDRLVRPMGRVVLEEGDEGSSASVFEDFENRADVAEGSEDGAWVLLPDSGLGNFVPDKPQKRESSLPSEPHEFSPNPAGWNSDGFPTSPAGWYSDQPYGVAPLSPSSQTSPPHSPHASRHHSGYDSPYSDSLPEPAESEGTKTMVSISDPYSALEMVISIVGGFFGQSDLIPDRKILRRIQ